MSSNHAIVVGGTRGLGRGLVELWAESTDRISVISRNVPAPRPALRDGVQFYAADITRLDEVERTVEQILAGSGAVSRLVFSQRFRGAGADSLQEELEVGLVATDRTIDQLVSKNQFTRPASIVIVSSVASHLIAPEQSLGYHVNKAALEQLVRYQAVRLAPLGIRINAVAPNLILKEESRAFYQQHPALRQQYESLIPLGTMGSPRDVAFAIDFLASDRAAHITGQTLVVDGGLTLLLQHGLVPKPPVP